MCRPIIDLITTVYSETSSQKLPNSYSCKCRSRKAFFRNRITVTSVQFKKPNLKIYRLHVTEQTMRNCFNSILFRKLYPENSVSIKKRHNTVWCLVVIANIVNESRFHRTLNLLTFDLCPPEPKSFVGIRFWNENDLSLQIRNKIYERVAQFSKISK